MAELSPDDRLFVENAKAALTRYLAERRFSSQIQLAYRSGFVFVLMAIGVAAALLFALPNYIHPLLATWRVPVRELLFYVSNPPTGVLPLLLFLLALVVAASLFVARRSDEFAEYAMKEFKLGLRDTRERTARRLGRRLAKLVARGAVSTQAPFDPRQFMIDSYRAMARPVFAVTAALGVITIALLVNDIRSYTAFTSEAVKAVRWFGLVSQDVAYADVRAVNVACHLTQDDGEDEAWISYDIDIAPSVTAHLFGEGTMRSLAPNRPAVDRKLAMAGVPFTYETMDHRSGARSQGISRECADTLEARYRAETRPLIRALIAAAIVES